MLILHVWKICEMPKAAPENGKCHSFVFTDTIAPISTIHESGRAFSNKYAQHGPGITRICSVKANMVTAKPA